MQRFGRNRNGSQRYRCDTCARTFTDEQTRPADRRRVEESRLTMCLRMLLEGMSIRSAERLTGIHRDTIIAALVEAGDNCQRWLAVAVRGVPAADVQADEIWGFVHCKEKTRERRNLPQEMGDAYCFTALERNTKLILAWHLGKRCPLDTAEFADKLYVATEGRFQLTTDGYTPYQTVIPTLFRSRVDFATLVKVYGEPEEEARRRYSPPRITEVIATVRTGEPDPALICTSHVERSNLTIRMMIRRMTRLTNAFSKKWDNHEAALALFFAYYNFCRPHMTLTESAGHKCTPAMASNLTDYVWSLQELLRNADRV